MPKSYREVFDAWQRSRAFGDQRSLEDYAKGQAKLYNTSAYDVGMDDSLWKQISTRLDIGGEALASVSTEPLMRSIGAAVGQEETGTNIGRGLPRAAFNMLPLVRGGALGALGTGALMGGHTYAETDSPTAGLVSGTAGALMPGAAYLGARGAAAFGAKGLGQYTAANIAALVPNTASAVAQQEILSPDEPFNWKNFFVETALSQIPFTAYDAIKAPVRTTQIREAQEARERGPVPFQPEPPKPPPVQKRVVAEGSEEARAKIAALAQRHAAIVSDTKATPEEKALAVQQLYQSVTSGKPVQTQTPSARLNPNVQVQQAPVKLTGRMQKVGPGSFRVLVDSAESAQQLNVNPGDTVFVNNATPVFDAKTGRYTFEVSVKDLKPATYPLSDLDFGVRKPQVDPTQPDLPVQEPPVPLSQEEIQRQAEAIQGKLTEAEKLIAAKVGVEPAKLETEMGTSEPVKLSDNLELLFGEREKRLQIGDEMGAKNVENRIFELLPNTEESVVPEGTTPEEWSLQVQRNKQIVDEANKRLTREREQRQEEVHQALGQHEQAVAAEEAALAKANEELQTESQVLETLDLTQENTPAPIVEKVKAEMQGKLDQGATPAQAVNQKKLSRASKDVDKAQQQQKVAEKKLTKKQEVEENARKGTALLEAYEALWQADPKGETVAHQVYNTIRKLMGDTEQVVDPQFSKRLMVVLAKTAGQSPSTVIKALNRTKNLAKRKPSDSVKSYLDENGNRVYGTKEELNKYIQEHGLDPARFGPEKTDGRKGKDIFFIGERIYRETTTLDSPVGENETSTVVENIAAQVPERLPVVTVDDLVAQIDEIIKDPQEYANDIVADEATQEQVLNEIESLHQTKEIFALKEEQGIDTESFLTVLNKRLRDKGLPEFDTPGQMKDTWKRVTKEVFQWANQTREYGLRSEKKKSWAERKVPHWFSDEDIEFTKQTRIWDGPAEYLEWLGTQDLGFANPLVKAYLKLKDQMFNLRIRLPDDKGFRWEGGYHYHEDMDGPYIQLPALPMKDTVLPEGLRYLHEVTHFFERYVDRRNDPAAVEYRQVKQEALAVLRASKELPGDVRKALTHILKSDLMGRWRRDEIDSFMNTLIKETGLSHETMMEWSDVIYGLSDVNELVTTMFNSPRLIALMRNTKMKSKGVVRKVLDVFSEWWSRLWAVPMQDNMVLARLLNSYDNYLSTGVLRSTYGGIDYIRGKLLQEGAHPDTLALRLQSIDRMFNRGGELLHSLRAFEQERSTDPSAATRQGPGILDRGVREAVLTSTSPKNVHDSVMKLTLDQLPIHQELLLRLTQDMQTVNEVKGLIERKVIPGMVPDMFEQPQHGIERAKLNAFRTAMQKQLLAVERLQAMDKLTPEGWEAEVARQITSPTKLKAPDEVPNAAEIRQHVALEGLEGRGMSWLGRVFAFAQHMKEFHAELKPVINGVFEEQGLARERAWVLNTTLLWDPGTGDRPGTVSKDIKKTLERVASTPSLIEAVSDIFRYQNLQGRGQLVDLSSSFVQEQLRRFNPKDRDAIVQTLESVAQRHKAWTELVLPDNFGFMNREYTAGLILAREEGMLPDVARYIADEIYGAIGQLKNPQEAFIAAQRLQALQSRVSPDTYIRMIQHAQRLVEKTNTWIERIRKMPGWVSETRFGKDHLILLNPDGRHKARWSGTREEMLKKWKEKELQGYKLLDHIKAEDTRAPRFGIDDEVMNALDELDMQNEVVAAELLADMPDKAAAFLPLIRRGQSVRDIISAGQPLPKISRRFVEGREDINMFDNSNQYYDRMNNWFRHKRTRARTQVDKMHPELRGNRELTKYVDDHVGNFLSPDNPIARKFVSATYFYKLGFDFGNAMLEATQNLTTGMAALIQETGGVGDAYDLWQSAIKDIISHKTTKKWASEEQHWLMERAAIRGDIDTMVGWQDIADPDHTTMYDTSPTRGGKGPLALVQHGAKRFGSFFVRYNNQIALMAGFKIARQKGMSMEDSYRFATDLMRRGLYTGGKAQRSVGLFGIKTKAVPQLISALQTYTTGWFGQMAEAFHKGFSKNAPKDLTPQQRIGAKKAFFYMLASQAALAGVLGLPGVGQGLALTQQMTGLDLKGWLKQNLAKLFDEDEEAGGVMSSLALRGIGAGGLPFDPSSRAALSIPYTGVNAYDGFSIANLGGAATATLGDFFDGAMAMFQGDKTAAAKLLPNALKRPYQLWQGEGDIRDKRGGLVMKLSPAERIFMTLGITPSRVQAQRDVMDAQRKMDERADRQKASLVDGLAVLVRQGKVDEVKQRLAELYQEDPDLDVEGLVRSIGRRVEAQTTPFDYRRVLPSGSEMAGLPSGLPSTERQRMNIRHNTEQMLGVQSRPDYQAMVIADLMDQLMDQDPFLTRAEARRLAEDKVRVRRRNVPSYIQAFQ